MNTDRNDKLSGPRLTRRGALLLGGNAAAVAAVASVLGGVGADPGGAPLLPAGAAAPPADQGPAATPWLLVPYTPDDDGQRPLPHATPMWICPSILVNGLPYADQPLPPGVPVALTVTPRNRGELTSLVLLRLYWTDTTTAFSPTRLHLIGQSTAVMHTNNGDALGPVIWIPPANVSRHVCLLAELTSVGDPSPGTFDAAADRHYGQQNVQLALTPPGKPVTFRFAITNSTSRTANCRLVAQPAGSYVLAAIRHMVPAGVQLGQLPAAVALANAQPDGRTELTVALKGNEQLQASATVSIPGNAAPRTAYVTELSQYRDGVLVGGMGAIALVG
jgi:hypothetical protein